MTRFVGVEDGVEDDEDGDLARGRIRPRIEEFACGLKGNCVRGWENPDFVPKVDPRIQKNVRE